jgi:hypothetical protein
MNKKLKIGLGLVGIAGIVGLAYYLYKFKRFSFKELIIGKGRSDNIPIEDKSISRPFPLDITPHDRAYNSFSDDWITAY